MEFVSLGTFPNIATINFSPNTALPTGVTYILRDDRTPQNEWKSTTAGFNGQISATEHYNNGNYNVTFTQTFYLNGTEITGTNSKRTVVVNVLTLINTEFSAMMSDTGSVTLKYPADMWYDVAFVSLAASFPNPTIDFSPNAALPTGVTYILKDDRTPQNSWNSTTNGFNGQITAADHYVDVNDDVTFTQTFYLNGVEITGTGSKRTVVVTALTSATTRFVSSTSDSGSVTLKLR